MLKSWNYIINSNQICQPLRHSFISNLISAGTDINTVKELAGHGNISTTAQYIHTTNELKRKAVEML